MLSYYPTPSTAALETVTGAGLLDVIRDDRLVRDLQLYTQLIEGLIDTQNRSFRPVRNEFILLRQRYGLSAYGEVPDETLIALVEDHEELAATLRTSAELAHIHALLLERMIEKADEILSRIESEAEATL